MKGVGLFGLACLSLAHAETDWTNDIIKRNIYLNTAIVREDLTITATPTKLDGEGEDRYLIVLQPGKHAVGYKAIEVKEGGQKTQELEMEEISQDTEEYIEKCLGSKDERNRCFWVHGFRMAGISLKKDQQITINVGIAYRNFLKTKPEYWHVQNDPLGVQLEESAFAYSPYPTKKQKTSIVIPSNFKILSKSCPAPNQIGKATKGAGMPQGMVQYSCGVYEDVASWTESEAPLKVHYNPQDVAFVTVEKLERSYTVLPWFNLLTVQETYTIRHDGFKHPDGTFERAEFLKSVMQRDPKVQFIGAYPLVVPASAYDVDVRDENGRLTGKHQRNSNSPMGQNYHQFNVVPRYPLTGGWKYSLTVSYKLPLNVFLGEPSKGLRELAIPLFTTVFDVAVEELSLRFNLPEDATLQEYVYDHYDTKRIGESLSSYKTYFSTKGEQVLELSFSNLSKSHVHPISIVYAYPWWGIFRKPLTIILSLVFALACFKFGASFDFSVQKNGGKNLDELGKLVSLRRETLRNLDDLILQAGKPDALPKRQALQSDINKLTESILEELRTAVRSNPRLAISGASLKKLYEEHMRALNAVFEACSKKSASDDHLGKLESAAISLDQAILKQEAKLFRS